MKAKHLFFFAVLFMLGLGTLTPPASFAQHYPDRPIQLIIPFVAGATGDITARLLAGELEKILGTKVIPMNKPGASAVVGTDAAARSKKDGYTLVYTAASAMVYAPATNPEIIKYDPAKDLEPLGLHYFFPMTITVRADSPWKTFTELVDYAKKKPEEVRVSTVGIASTPHFVLEMIQSLTDAKFTHVPFKGGEAVMVALLGGHVEVTCDGFAKVKPHIDAGKMRVLLITNKMPEFPEIPLITELGYKKSLPGTWFALYAPAGIPEEVKKVLVPAIEKAVKNTKDKIEKMGSIADYRSPSELRKLVAEEYAAAYDIAVKVGLRK
jgi:tripartite-type tricarboxylate transporter receptor subunit TctC